jgi:asparagine synthase (glutamine-hydrolysing)
MAHSVEVRVPLVDRILLEKLAPLLVAPNRTPGKIWLARAPRPRLPEAVVRRPKTGFATPMKDWLLRIPKLQGENFPANLTAQTHWSRRWALCVLSQFVPKLPDISAAA